LDGGWAETEPDLAGAPLVLPGDTDDPLTLDLQVREITIVLALAQQVVGGDAGDDLGRLVPQQEHRPQELRPGRDRVIADARDAGALLDHGLSVGEEEVAIELVDDGGEGAADTDLRQGEDVGQDGHGIETDEQAGKEDAGTRPGDAVRPQSMPQGL